jgi:flagellar protein FliS
MTVGSYQAYSDSASQQTDSKEQILLILLEGALKFLRFTHRGIEEKNPKIRGENISKIMAILTELDCALDRENGGMLAENLSLLYEYMMKRLTEANTQNSIQALDEVEKLLLDIKEGFEAAAEKLHQKTASQAKLETGGSQKGLCFAV